MGDTGKVFELEELITLLRKRGVRQFKGFGVELVLDAHEPVIVAADKDSTTAQTRYADGLTAEEQQELYGRVIG